MESKKYSVSVKYTISPVTGKWGEVKDVRVSDIATLEEHKAAWDETRALMKRLAALPIP